MATTTPRFTILIDGACSLCKREAAFMRRMDKGRGLLAFVDISAPDFDPGLYGCTLNDVMGRIHGVTASGEIITGMPVFRHAYSAIGIGWLAAPTGWPLLRPIFDRLYILFAKNRWRFSKNGKPYCENGSCALPSAPKPSRAS